MVPVESKIYTSLGECVKSAVLNLSTAISRACFVYSHGNLQKSLNKSSRADQMLFVNVDVTAITLMCLDGWEYASAVHGGRAQMRCSVNTL